MAADKKSQANGKVTQDTSTSVQDQLKNKLAQVKVENKGIEDDLASFYAKNVELEVEAAGLHSATTQNFVNCM